MQHQDTSDIEGEVFGQGNVNQENQGKNEVCIVEGYIKGLENHVGIYSPDIVFYIILW